MKAVLNIPPKINVGYQKRNDTYTGKLAFVVYTNEKGELKQKTSWNSWRDKSISPDEFENVPTQGFVLNKKVGENTYNRNPRKAWIRIYDPRGFEFEISVANLIFILEECSSIKGKGIEGEFVYSWDGAKLLLLPTSSQLYKESLKFISIKGVVKKQDLKEGYVYLDNNNVEQIYLGYLPKWGFQTIKNDRFWRAQKYHVFWNDKNKYTFKKNTNHLVSKISDDSVSNYADLYEEYIKSDYGSKPIKLKSKLIYRKDLGYWDHGFVKKDNGYILLHKTNHWNYYNTIIYIYKISQDPVKLTPGKSVKIPDYIDKYRPGYYNHLQPNTYNVYNDSSLYKLYIVNEAGSEIEIY